MACQPQLDNMPAAYTVVPGGCDWPIN